MIRGLVTALVLCAAPAASQPLRLDLPIDCVIGDSCFVQNYVDRDPGPGAVDFACHGLTYDGHQGTDIALTDTAAMRAGVMVRAAAPGVVRAMRDGMPDIPFTDPDAPDLTDRSCGNAVIIDHAGGWQTRYCHLRRDSVLVRSGDSVAAGTPIGQVGLSGKTEFEHLHVSVHHDGQVVDPFQPGEAATCGETGETLWSVPVPYLPGGLIAAGFAAEVPEFRQIKSGTAHRDSLPATAPALVLWGHMFGSRPGDLLRFDITGETGTVLSRTFQLDRTQARLFRATGRKRGAAPWTAGPYTGIVRLIRNGQEIDRQTNTVTIRD